MLVINYLDITDINNDSYQLFRKAVSEERRRRADCFHFIDDAKRCICAELLLQYSLFLIVGHLVEIDVIYNEYGKPFLNNIKKFSYNLSHSGKWVAIAYASSEVGIDIEKIQIVKEDIVDNFFTEEEKKFVRMVTEEERTKRFTQIWTLKESYIKYLGTGLSRRLNSFSVDALHGLVTNQYGEIQKGLRIKSYLFMNDYYLSVCSMENEIITKEIGLKDLKQFVNRSKD